MPNPYLPYPVRLTDVFSETEDGTLRTFSFEFENPAHRTAFTWTAGQFAQISVPGAGECPIGIASSPTETGPVRFTVSRAGVVTTRLHELSPGALLGLRGPLGNGYPFEACEGRDMLLVAGGYAVTTLRAALVWLLAPENRRRYGRIVFVYGARTPGMLLYRDELAAWQKRADVDCRITIDREQPGWSGLTGFVPAVVEALAPSPVNAAAFVCGPPPMIRFTRPVLDRLGWRPEDIYLSLENRMKCGIGICGRCNVGPEYVCRDGPVFSCARLAELPPEM